MSLSKQKRLTGHLPVLAFLFALPVLFVHGRSYFEQRAPASYKKPVNKNLYYEHKFDRKKKNHRENSSKLSGKPNGTFRTDVIVSVMNYRPEDKMAEMKVRLEFSPRIDTDIVNISWKLPEGYSPVGRAFDCSGCSYQRVTCSNQVIRNLYPFFIWL